MDKDTQTCNFTAAHPQKSKTVHDQGSWHPEFVYYVHHKWYTVTNHEMDLARGKSESVWAPAKRCMITSRSSWKGGTLLRDTLDQSTWTVQSFLKTCALDAGFVLKWCRCSPLWTLIKYCHVQNSIILIGVREKSFFFRTLLLNDSVHNLIMSSYLWSTVFDRWGESTKCIRNVKEK